ncbi:MAG: hypothetical protein ABIS47_08645 [Acidimicrobiales bacterium]
MSGNRRGWPYEPVDGAGAPVAVAPPVELVPEPVALPAPAALSRRALVLLAIGGAVALLLTSLAVGDWWVRNAELRTLLGRVEQAERAQLPAIQTLGQLLLLCQREAAGDREQVCDTVGIRQGAERVLPRLRQTGNEVAATRLTSFHDSLRTFRDRYVDHNLAWQAWLDTLTRDPTAGDFEAPDSISTTFEAASRAADDALTPLPLHGNGDRIEKIFLSVR